jgi:hypothetical protein
MQNQMRQFLAPYADVLKQLSAKSSELKGYPLKTVVRIAFGGEHCSSAKQQSAGGGGNAVTDASQAAGDAAAASAAGTAGSAAGAAAGNVAKNSVGSSIFSSAASTFGSKLTSGLFKKKADAAAPAANSAPDNGLPPGVIQAAQITVETTSIDASPVPADKFEIPAGWKKVEPKTKDTGSKEFSCPSAGS